MKYKKIIKVSLFVLFLFICVYTFIIANKLQYHMIVGKNLVNETCPISKMQFRNPNSEKKFLVFGDSVSRGVGSSTCRYTFSNQLYDKYQANIDSIVVSGLTIDKSLDVWKKYINPNIHYDLCVITIGGNDVINNHGYKMENTMKNYTEIMNMASKQCKYVVASSIGNMSELNNIVIFPFNYIYDNLSKDYNIMFSNICNKFDNISYVNFWRNKFILLKKMFSEDNFHLNDLGYKIIFNEIDMEIKNFFT